MVTEAILAEMTNRLVELFAPERIILFGSQARGQAHGHSDVDLLIIGRWEGNRYEIASNMYRALWSLGVSKDLVLVTPEEFEKSKHYPWTVCGPAWREGKVVYERPI